MCSVCTLPQLLRGSQPPCSVHLSTLASAQLPMLPCLVGASTVAGLLQWLGPRVELAIAAGEHQTRSRSEGACASRRCCSANVSGSASRGSRLHMKSHSEENQLPLAALQLSTASRLAGSTEVQVRDAARQCAMHRECHGIGARLQLPGQLGARLRQ